MTSINKLYGYFTDGDNTKRKTSTSRSSLADEPLRVVKALVPSTTDASTKRGLAELYIRLCFTDKDLAAALLAVDPVNSYRLHSFYDTISSNLKWEQIVSNIRQSSIPDIENSALSTDYIMCALRYLLQLLNG